MALNTIETKRFWFLTTLILAVACVRLFSLPLHNFSPIGAMALFGAAYFRDRIFAFVVPLMALFLTDVILEVSAGIGFYEGMPFIYGAFFLTGCIGFLLRNKVGFLNVAGGAIASSVIFFLVTNLGAWLANPLYPPNFMGLMQSYAAGLAFYKAELFGNFFLNTVFGTLFFSAVLFGVFEFVKKWVPAISVNQAS